MSPLLEPVLRTERETRRFRLITLFAVSGILLARQHQIEVLPSAALVGSYLVYTLLLSAYIIPRIKTHYVVYGMALVDATAVLLGLFYAGGLQSPLLILPTVFILYYAIYFGYSSSFFSAIAFSLGYGTLALVDNRLKDAGGNLVAIQVPLFLLIAFLGGYLSKRRLQERQEKEELQEFIRVRSKAKGLLDVAQSLGAGTSLQQVLRQVVTEAPLLLGVGHGSVALFDQDGKTLVMQAGNEDVKGLVETQQNGARYVPVPQSTTQQALTAKQPVMADLSGAQNGQTSTWEQKLGAAFLLASPLLVKGEPIGVLYLFDTKPRKAFTEYELGLAHGYSLLAANAIAKAREHEQAQGQITRFVDDMEQTIQRMEHLREPQRKREILLGDMRIDGAKEQVFVSGQLVNLSPTEFEVLYVLAENAGSPLNQETLLRRVWGDSYTGKANVVDVCVHRLRKKLGKEQSQSPILTIRGVGYLLSPEGAKAAKP